MLIFSSLRGSVFNPHRPAPIRSSSLQFLVPFYLPRSAPFRKKNPQNPDLRQLWVVGQFVYHFY
jgi:hypothetical protein